jgi:hypothetical protein
VNFARAPYGKTRDRHGHDNGSPGRQYGYSTHDCFPQRRIRPSGAYDVWKCLTFDYQGRDFGELEGTAVLKGFEYSDLILATASKNAART